MGRTLALVTGTEGIERQVVFWLALILVMAALFAYPSFASEFEAGNIAYYLLNIPIALGLCVLWGYCGVLSFGQVAYFGIAGYAYGLIAGNMVGNSWGPLIGSLGGLATCVVVSGVF